MFEKIILLPTPVVLLLIIDALFNCILDIKSWMAENFLQLNQDKTEVLVIGPEGRREELLPKLRDFKPSQYVKNLGVVFDSELTFVPHIHNITKIGFYHLKNIARNIQKEHQNIQKECLQSTNTTKLSRTCAD